MPKTTQVESAHHANGNQRQTPQNLTTQQAQPVQYVAPQVNIFETADGYCLEAEMPGVAKEGLDIRLDGHEITIVGHRKTDPTEGDPIFRERQPYDYRRVFELDPAIDASKISAKMEQGILTVCLPKSEQVKPRKISVD
jgi:HSP20 family protein